MKSAEALAHLRHLSCLGLGSELVIPPMLSTVAELIPALTCNFVWTDRQGAMVNTFAPWIAPSTMDVLHNHYHLFLRPGELSTEVMAAGGRLSGNSAHWLAGDYQRTLTYNEVFRPNGAGDVLDLVLRDDHGPRGILMVFRGPGAPGFSGSERRLLESLSPWFLHALEKRPPMKDMEFGQTDDQVVLLCDRSGAILQSGPEAHVMLVCAGHGVVAPGLLGADLGLALPPLVRRLCRNLGRIRDGRPAPTPSAKATTRWGRFIFHAHPLATGDGASDLVTVVIRREEPLPLRILRRLKTLPLTPRQRQVALLIGLERPPEDIQRELGVTHATYRTYVEQIHTRLEIRSRASLIAAIRA